MIELSPVTIAAIGTAAVVIIGALAGGIVTIITALHTLSKDTESIKGHVNSEKTAAEGREATLRKENELLREMVIERKAAADLLAQAAATRGRAMPDVVSVVPVPVRPARATDADAAMATSLASIDENTAAIEQNTARTEAAVQGLKKKP